MNAFNSQRLSKWFSKVNYSPPATGSSKINVGTTERVLSAIGGLLLTTWGLQKKGLPGILAAVTGGGILYRGISGYCPVNEELGRNTAYDKNSPIEVSTRLFIDKPKNLLYRYWRNLENLPNFMEHLNEVKESGNISYWSAKIPGGLGEIDWEAEILQEEENYLIIWRSLPGSEVDNAGEVKFLDALDGKGTVVETTISYRPPAGELGEYAAKLFNPAFRKVVEKDLRNFKNFMEAGDFENETFRKWEETGNF